MATPTQIKRRGRFSLILGTIFATLTVGAVIAYGDTIITDGDALITSGNNTTVALPAATRADSTKTAQASFQLHCAGNQHVDRTKMVTIAFDSVHSTAGLSATDATIGSIPNTWPTDTNACGSTGNLDDNGNSTVTVTVPSSLGAHTYTSKWNANLNYTDASAITGSGPSVIYNLDVNPRPASGLSATANGQNEIDLSWTASPDSADITEYVIFEGAAQVATAGNSDTTKSITGLLAGSNHCYTIKARYNDGTTDYFSSAAGPACATTDAVPTNTAPTVSVTDVIDGNSYEIGSVPAAGCSVVDAEDGNSNFAATLSAITGVNATYGIGSQTANCSYTDGGGITRNASATYSIVDTGNPTITFASRTPANANNWNKTDVTVTWSCSDSGSGVLSATATETVSTEGSNQPATGTCTDHAGNTATDTQTEINIDKTAPTDVTTTLNDPPDHNTWYNAPVDWTTTGTDPLSGIPSGGCDSGTYSGPEGTDVTVSGMCTDKAGNSSALAASDPFDYDSSAPTAALSVTGGTAGANGWYTSNVTVHTAGADLVSGIESCTDDQQQTSETTGTVFHGSCTNGAGLTTPADPITIKLDKTGPSATLSVTAGLLGNNGWYTSDVTVHTDGSDAISGIDSCTADQSLSSNSAGTDFNGSCTNKAGLSTDADTLTIKLDKNAPNVTLNGLSEGAVYTFGSVPSGSCTTTEVGPSGKASDATLAISGPSNGVGAFTATCAGATDNAGNATAPVSVHYSVNWNWTGFFQPVDNLPALNKAKAGSAIPVKFNLGGNQGLSIFFSSVYPTSGPITCGGTASADAIEETLNAGGSSLTYDTTASQYIYVWKTLPSWSNSCRTLTLKLADGTSHQANFWFVK